MESSFHFVVGNPNSEQERRREVQLARSHTARVNRQKRRPHTRGEGATQRGGRGGLPNLVTSASHSRPNPVSIGSKRADLKDKKSLSGSGILESLWSSRISERSGSTTSSRTASSRTVADTSDPIDEREVVFATPRTLSPVLGASTTGAFANGPSLHDNARATDYCKT